MSEIYVLLVFSFFFQWSIQSAAVYLPSLDLEGQYKEACYSYDCNDASNGYTIAKFIICKNVNIIPEDSRMLLQMILPKDAKYIGFENASLSLITKEMFSHFTNLAVLNLKKSKVVTIVPTAFYDMVHLEELYLQDNCIAELARGTFRSQKNLKVLDISNNLLKTVRKFHFETLVNLKILNMANNPFHLLEPNCFVSLISLERLDLTNSNIICEPFCMLHIKPENWKRLLMDSNKSNIFKETGNLTQLKYFDAFYNTWPQINSQLNTLRKLKSANLSHNKIERMCASYFEEYNLRELDLSYNLIEWIDETFFQNLTLLEKLYLNNNRIAFLIPGSFYKLRYLTYLSLSYNQLISLKNNSFAGLDKLETLRIDHNKLTQHDLPISNLRNLRRLYLHYNLLSSIFAAGIVENSLKLEIITLKSNRWDCEQILDAIAVFQNYSIAVTESDAEKPYISNLACQLDCIHDKNVSFFLFTVGVVLILFNLLVFLLLAIRQKHVSLVNIIKNLKAKPNNCKISC